VVSAFELPGQSCLWVITHLGAGGYTCLLGPADA
jgi:hypothetical protein